MFGAPEDIVDQMADALFKAAMYVGHADDDKTIHDDDLEELKSLSVAMHAIKDQNAQSAAMSDVITHVQNHIRDYGNPEDFSHEKVETIVKSLENAPSDVEDAVTAALNSLSKDEARAYADTVIASCASVAQTHDEKEEKGFFNRMYISLQNLVESPVSRYLYDSSNVHDQMKISKAEEVALDKICLAVRNAWEKKYPDDLVEDV
jgi:small-conductance mechanosensitive channel